MCATVVKRYELHYPEKIPRPLALGRQNTRADAPVDGGGCTMRELGRMVTDERRTNQKNRKKDFRHGLRWLVEIIISAL